MSSMQRLIRLLFLVLSAAAAPWQEVHGQCSSIAVAIGSTGHYTQILDINQTYTMPADGLVTGFTFYGAVPGGQSGNITYRVYRMPEDTLVATATIFEVGVGDSYYGANFGYQPALYFTAGSVVKVRLSAGSLSVLNRVYYSNNNPYSGGAHSMASVWDMASRLYTSVAPSLSFSSNGLPFGTVPVGTPTTDTLIVTNPGCYTLAISSVTKSSSQISVTPTSAYIAAGGTQEFYVTYTPSGATTVADSLTFVSDAPANGTQKVPVSGTGAFQAQSDAGNALVGNGTNAYVATTVNPSIVNNSFTFEGWFKSSSSTPSGWFFGQGTANTNQGLHIGYIGSTSIRFGMWSDDVDFSSMSDAENWHHFAFTFNSSTKFQAIYRDGVLVASRTANNNFTGSGTLSIGNLFGGGTTSCFAGSMEEVRLWNTARTAAQIREHMHLSLAGNETGLLGYWRLDETSGTIAGDGTGNGYHATLQNSPTRVTSALPLGAGESSHATGITTGSTFVDGFSMGLVNDFDNATDVLVTRIDSDPNVLPEGSSTLLEGQYFIVNVFGNPGTYSSSVTITVPAEFTSNATANPGNYTLYSRASNSTGIWSTAVSGLSVMNATNITFNGLTSFSQFYVGTNDPLPVQMVGWNAEVSSQQSEVRLSWRTASEVDNVGWEVERRTIANVESTIANFQKVGFVEGAGTSSSPREYSFTDDISQFPVRNPQSRLVYRLKQIDRNGDHAYSGEAEIEVGLAPRDFSLGQNYPNPFNPTTAITFTLPEDGHVTLEVFDLLGRRVASLFNEPALSGRLLSATFDASQLPSGIYFARLQSGTRQLLKKMTLMK